MPTIPYKQLKDESGNSFYPVCGASSFSDAVPIAKGGTGADNAADARVNLGVNIKSVSISGATDSSGDFSLSSYISVGSHVPVAFLKTSNFPFSAAVFGQTGAGTTWYMKLLNDNAGNMASQSFAGTLYYFDL